MEVALWQLGIFIAIVLASLIFGWRGWAWSVVLAAIWTVVKIFTSWLMVLQFGTIALAAIVGAVIGDAWRKTSAERRTNYRKAILETGQLVGLAIFILVAGGLALREHAAVAPPTKVFHDNSVTTSPSAAIPALTLSTGNDVSYARLVRKYERDYPAYDSTSPQYNPAAVRETLMRKSYYEFVDGVGEVEALKHAVNDMLMPPAKRTSVQIVKNATGGCRYHGSGNRKLVSIDGECPAIAPDSAQR